MESRNEINSVIVSQEQSEYIPSETDLKLAELKKIKAEQAKFDAEAKEINSRLNQPWWFVRPSALIQAVIGGIVAAVLVASFMLDNFIKIHTVNVEAQKNLEAKNEKLQEETTLLAQQLAEAVRDNQKLKDENKNLLTQTSKKLASAEQDLKYLQSKESNSLDFRQKEVEVVKAEINDLKQTINNLTENASSIQQRAKVLDKLIQSRLEGVTILIRYSSDQAKVDALKIKSILEDIELKNVEIKRISELEMRNRWFAEDYQIRYFKNTEEVEANILQEKIQVSSAIQLRLQKASTQTPNFLSVFLP